MSFLSGILKNIPIVGNLMGGGAKGASSAQGTLPQDMLKAFEAGKKAALSEMQQTQLSNGLSGGYSGSGSVNNSSNSVFSQ